jgi:hypothetical protein
MLVLKAPPSGRRSVTSTPPAAAFANDHPPIDAVCQVAKWHGHRRRAGFAAMLELQLRLAESRPFPRLRAGVTDVVKAHVPSALMPIWWITRNSNSEVQGVDVAVASYANL